MKILNFKKPIFIILVLLFAFYVYLTVPYWEALFQYYSLSGSGVRYSLKGRIPKDIEEEVLIINPVSSRFGLVISELGINEKVTQDIDFYDSQELESHLTKGLVHLKNSSLPGRFGGVLIIGHPLHSFFNFDHLNPDFYLISKLNNGDEISVLYNGFEFLYQVEKKELKDLTFLDFFDPGQERRLFLVSGYPPGMALKFLVIKAKEIY